MTGGGLSKAELAALCRVADFLTALSSLKATEVPGGGEWPDDFSIDTCLRHDLDEHVNTELNESDLRIVASLAARADATQQAGRALDTIEAEREAWEPRVPVPEGWDYEYILRRAGIENGLHRAANILRAALAAPAREADPQPDAGVRERVLALAEEFDQRWASMSVREVAARLRAAVTPAAEYPTGDPDVIDQVRVTGVLPDREDIPTYGDDQFRNELERQREGGDPA